MRPMSWVVALLLGGAAGRAWAGVPDACVQPPGPEFEVNSVGDQDCDFTGTDDDPGTLETLRGLLTFGVLGALWSSSAALLR